MVPTPLTVEGIQTQGERGTDTYVETFCIEYTVDGETWYDVVDDNDEIVVSTDAIVSRARIHEN